MIVIRVTLPLADIAFNPPDARNAHIIYNVGQMICRKAHSAGTNAQPL